MEFKYSTASDRALTTRYLIQQDVLEWLQTGEIAKDAPWVTFPLSRIMCAFGLKEKGWDGKTKRFAKIVLEMGRDLYIVEDENIRKILAETMWKNVFGPEEEEEEEEETNEED